MAAKSQSNQQYFQQERELREEQRKAEEKQRLINEAFNQNGELDRDWMNNLIDAEDLEDRLQERTIRKIRSSLTKEWVLAHLSDAEAHDARYWYDVLQIKIMGEHPPAESCIQGPLRAYLNESVEEGVMALSPAERNTMNQVIQALKARLTRGRGGFERKQMNTQYAAAVNEKSTRDESQGRLSGLFS